MKSSKRDRQKEVKCELRRTASLDEPDLQGGGKGIQNKGQPPKTKKKLNALRQALRSRHVTKTEEIKERTYQNNKTQICLLRHRMKRETPGIGERRSGKKN